MLMSKPNGSTSAERGGTAWQPARPPPLKANRGSGTHETQKGNGNGDGHGPGPSTMEVMGMGRKPQTVYYYRHNDSIWLPTNQTRWGAKPESALRFIRLIGEMPGAVRVGNGPWDEQFIITSPETVKTVVLAQKDGYDQAERGVVELGVVRDGADGIVLERYGCDPAMGLDGSMAGMLDRCVAVPRDTMTRLVAGYASNEPDVTVTDLDEGTVGYACGSVTIRMDLAGGEAGGFDPSDRLLDESVLGTAVMDLQIRNVQGSISVTGGLFEDYDAARLYARSLVGEALGTLRRKASGVKPCGRNAILRVGRLNDPYTHGGGNGAVPPAPKPTLYESAEPLAELPDRRVGAEAKAAVLVDAGADGVASILLGGAVPVPEGWDAASCPELARIELLDGRGHVISTRDADEGTDTIPIPKEGLRAAHGLRYVYTRGAWRIKPEADDGLLRREIGQERYAGLPDYLKDYYEPDESPTEEERITVPVLDTITARPMRRGTAALPDALARYSDEAAGYGGGFPATVLVERDDEHPRQIEDGDDEARKADLRAMDPFTAAIRTEPRSTTLGPFISRLIDACPSLGADVLTQRVIIPGLYQDVTEVCVPTIVSAKRTTHECWAMCFNDRYENKALDLSPVIRYRTPEQARAQARSIIHNLVTDALRKTTAPADGRDD